MTASEIRENGWKSDELLNAANGVIERLKKLTLENCKTMSGEKAVSSALETILNGLK